MSRYLNPSIRIRDYSHYSMHVFGFIAFISTLVLGIFAFIKHFDTTHENFSHYLLYGVLVFMINLFYLKAIRLSREDYEKQLKKEKAYSQSLLNSQKRFLRYAVHETNTPLAVIMANIELYEIELGEHPSLKNIEAATKNIFGIYDDLSYLTQQDKIEYPKHFIIFGDFIRSRIGFFNIVAQQLHKSFTFIDHTDNITLYFNETKLQRIIDNNITNAIKYTHDHEEIHIILSHTLKEIHFEIFSHSSIIEDTEQIFDAYYREDAIQEGLGLGLSLVKSICNQENVKITLESSEISTSFRYSFKKATL